MMKNTKSVEIVKTLRAQLAQLRVDRTLARVHAATQSPMATIFDDMPLTDVIFDGAFALDGAEFAR